MNDKEIILWVDDRWYQALSQQLKDETVEDKLNQHLDKLIDQLPEQVREKIRGEILAEDQRREQEAEAKREFSAVRPDIGWVSYQLKDVSTAVWHADRCGSYDWGLRQRRLAEKLAGKEIPTAGYLSAEDISLAEEICEMEEEHHGPEMAI